MSFLQHVLFVLLFFWHCGSPSVRHARKGKPERALRYEELLRFTSLTVNDGRLGVVATLEGEFGLAGADFPNRLPQIIFAGNFFTANPQNHVFSKNPGLGDWPPALYLHDPPPRAASLQGWRRSVLC